MPKWLGGCCHFKKRQDKCVDSSPDSSKEGASGTSFATAQSYHNEEAYRMLWQISSRMDPGDSRPGNNGRAKGRGLYPRKPSAHKTKWVRERALYNVSRMGIPVIEEEIQVHAEPGPSHQGGAENLEPEPGLSGIEMKNLTAWASALSLSDSKEVVEDRQVTVETEEAGMRTDLKTITDAGHDETDNVIIILGSDEPQAQRPPWAGCN